MRKLSTRTLCLWCLATVAFVSAVRAGESVVPSSGWPEAAQLMLLGAGLSYVGSRLAKHRA
jgi:hypothetical protein